MAERQVWKGGSGGGQVIRVSGRGRWEKRPRTSGPRHSRSLLPVPAPSGVGPRWAWVWGSMLPAPAIFQAIPRGLRLSAGKQGRGGRGWRVLQEGQGPGLGVADT